MREQFWRLPGPLSVLTEVRTALLSGESLVLRMPPWAPDPVPPLQSMLPGNREVHDITSVALDGQLPSERLLCKLIGVRDDDGLGNCGHRHAEPVITIRPAIGGPLDCWARLLRRHYHATRQAAGAARLLLVVDASESLDTRETGAAPLIDWKDAVRRLDMHLYAAQLLTNRSMSLLERELCTTMTREIAAWCPDVAEQMAEAGPQQSFQPIPILRCLAEQRQWTETTPASWSHGTLNYQYGIGVLHAALAAARGDVREIDRRLWRAQLEVLFPILEQLRAQLALRYSGQLRAIVDDAPEPAPSDPLEWDIGPLAHRLVTAPNVRGAHRRLAAAMRDLRRPLAHLRPVSRGLALAPAIVQAVNEGLELR